MLQEHAAVAGEETCEGLCGSWYVRISCLVPENSLHTRHLKQRKDWQGLWTTKRRTESDLLLGHQKIPPIPLTDKAKHCASWQRTSVYRVLLQHRWERERRVHLELRGNTLIIGIENNVWNGEDFEWEPNDGLITQQVLFVICPNLEKHDGAGEMKAELSIYKCNTDIYKYTYLVILHIY